MNNVSSTPMWEHVEICYFENVDDYTGDSPQRVDIENSEDIKELTSITESLQNELEYTSKPMGFPRYVVTFHGEDSTKLCFSIDSEFIFSGDFLDNGNYVLSSESDTYKKVSNVFNSFEQTKAESNLE